MTAIFKKPKDPPKKAKKRGRPRKNKENEPINIIVNINNKTVKAKLKKADVEKIKKLIGRPLGRPRKNKENEPINKVVNNNNNNKSVKTKLKKTALERHVNGHFNQTETNSSTSRKSTDGTGGKLVRRNGKKLRYRRQPWSARIFDYFDPGIMEGLQYRLQELAKTRTQGRLAETPGNAMALTSQVIARRVELDGKTKVLLRWHPQDIEPDEWVLESEMLKTKHVTIRKVVSDQVEGINVALYPALGSTLPLQRVKQRRKPVKDT